LPFSIGAGDQVTVVANAVTNKPTSGAGNLVFSTSSDPKTVSFKYKLKGKTADKFAAVQLTSTAATATQVSYAVHFTTIDALVQTFSTVTLAAPSGTTFVPNNGCAPYRVTDDTTNISSTCVTAVVSNGGATTTVTMPFSIGAGDAVTVTASAVANKSTAGGQTLTFSTSSDPKTVGLKYTLSAPTAVTNPLVTLTSHVHSATNVVYDLTFTATNGLSQTFSTITLAAPTGTVFAASSGCSPYTVTDLTTGASSSCLGNATVTNGGATVAIPTINIGAGDQVSVQATGVTNGSGAGAQTLNVSTSSDPVAVGTPYSLT
jgi:hypothetical protein